MVRRENDSVDERIEADLDFHRTLCRLSGNDTLLHSWTSLEGSIRMSIMWAGLERAVTNMNARRHLDIVEAIESGDPAQVTQTVDEHMGVAADVLVSGAA
jgi:DNA-binding FadR family transcriptional regulator